MNQSEAPTTTRRTARRPAVAIANSGREPRDGPHACTHCRKNKLRCSGERPRCTICLSKDVPCEYEETARQASTRIGLGIATTSRKRPAPASTSAQIKESRQRKRAAAAQTSCDFCKNDLRRKCDGLRPSCQSCRKRGEPCVYSGPASVPATSHGGSLPPVPRSDDEESDVAMPSRSHSPDVPLADSPTTPLDPNKPRYPQGNGLGHAGSARNPDGSNCTRPVACFFCIKVELPCTGDFPTCVNCVRRSIPCAYPEPSSYAHQFPRQSAMHTRQLKDVTPRRSNAGAAHASPGHGHHIPSRSHPMQTGATSPMSMSPDPMTHGRQRSLSGPNGLPGFGAEIIRSIPGTENLSRSTSGPRPTSSNSPIRPPNYSHSRTPSTTAPSPGQPTLSNPIPPVTSRSSAASPSTSIQNHRQPQIHNHHQASTASHPNWTPSTISSPLPMPGDVYRTGPEINEPPFRNGQPRQRPRIEDQRPTAVEPVRRESGSAPSTTQAPNAGGSVGTPSRNGLVDSNVHGKADLTSQPSPLVVNGSQPPTGEGAKLPATHDSRPVTVNDPRPPAPTSTTSRTFVPALPLTKLMFGSETSAAGINPTARSPANSTNLAANQPNEPRPPTDALCSTLHEESCPPRTEDTLPRPQSNNILPESIPRRSSIPSPITQHPTRDVSAMGPTPRQDATRRESGNGIGATRYDPRRDTGIRDDRRDERQDDRRGDNRGLRRDSASTPDDRRGSTSGRDSVNSRQTRPNPQSRPSPLLDTRNLSSGTGSRKESPHTPRNSSALLPLEPRGGPARERSPIRKRSASPGVGGTVTATGTDPKTVQNNRSRSQSKRRSRSPRGMYLRAESGSIRSSPMDMDSS